MACDFILDLSMPCCRSAKSYQTINNKDYIKVARQI